MEFIKKVILIVSSIRFLPHVALYKCGLGGIARRHYRFWKELPLVDAQRAFVQKFVLQKNVVGIVAAHAFSTSR